MEKTRKIYISDVTMKLTDASAGAGLSFRQKIELSKLLDRVGVAVIETGPFCGTKQDSLLVKSIASAVKGSALAVPVDIADPESAQKVWASLKDAAHPRLQVYAPVSTVQMEYLCHLKPSAMLELISSQVKSCAALCDDVEFIAGDCCRADEAFFADAVSTAAKAGATLVTICDNAGNLLPSEFSGMVKAVKDSLPDGVKLGVCCSNDLYMADACSVVAVMAGADEIKTTPYTNSTASLKRVVSILNAKADVCGAECGVALTEMDRVLTQVKRLCETPKKKSSTGLETSTEDRSALRLTIHDDKSAVLKVLSALGYELGEEDSDRVYDTFLRLASANGVVEAKELDAIVASVAFQVPPTYKLESFVINAGNIITATCHLRVRKGEELIERVSIGDGPVDAAFLAIEQAVGRHYELDDFQIQSVAEGSEAMGEAVVRLRHQGKVYSGRGISRDIVGSSVMAYINAVNKIAYEEEEA